MGYETQFREKIAQLMYEAASACDFSFTKLNEFSSLPFYDNQEISALELERCQAALYLLSQFTYINKGFPSEEEIRELVKKRIGLETEDAERITSATAKFYVEFLKAVVSGRVGRRFFIDHGLTEQVFSDNYTLPYKIFKKNIPKAINLRFEKAVASMLFIDDKKIKEYVSVIHKAIKNVINLENKLGSQFLVKRVFDLLYEFGLYLYQEFPHKSLDELKPLLVQLRKEFASLDYPASLFYTKIFSKDFFKYNLDEAGTAVAQKMQHALSVFDYLIEDKKSNSVSIKEKQSSSVNFGGCFIETVKQKRQEEILIIIIELIHNAYKDNGYNFKMALNGIDEPNSNFRPLIFVIAYFLQDNVTLQHTHRFYIEEAIKSFLGKMLEPDKISKFFEDCRVYLSSKVGDAQLLVNDQKVQDSFLKEIDVLPNNGKDLLVKVNEWLSAKRELARASSETKKIAQLIYKACRENGYDFERALANSDKPGNNFRQISFYTLYFLDQVSSYPSKEGIKKTVKNIFISSGSACIAEEEAKNAEAFYESFILYLSKPGSKSKFLGNNQSASLDFVEDVVGKYDELNIQVNRWLKDMRDKIEKNKTRVTSLGKLLDEIRGDSEIANEKEEISSLKTKLEPLPEDCSYEDCRKFLKNYTTIVKEQDQRNRLIEAARIMATELEELASQSTKPEKVQELVKDIRNISDAAEGGDQTVTEVKARYYLALKNSGLEKHTNDVKIIQWCGRFKQGIKLGFFAVACKLTYGSAYSWCNREYHILKRQVVDNVTKTRAAADAIFSEKMGSPPPEQVIKNFAAPVA